MNLVYYKSDIGNFGDDLNPWLWDKIFGNFAAYADEYDFIGIGSMLDHRINNETKKIIFGAGVRDFLFEPELSQKNDILFVRGPISSKVMGNAPYITDAAYCLALLENEPVEKKYKVAFMPYFRHVNNLNWKLFEKISGIKVILPTNPVEQVIQEIRESESLFTAAMHGAIAADIYRVPWMRVKFSNVLGESALTSELKWSDWSQSIGMYDIPSKNLGFTLNYPNSSVMSNLVKILSMAKTLKYGHFLLSEESTFNRKIKELNEQVCLLKAKYKKTKNLNL